jgi:hypothetical protein
VDYCWLDMVFGHPLQALQSTATAAVVTHQISRLFRGGGVSQVDTLSAAQHTRRLMRSMGAISMHRAYLDCISRAGVSARSGLLALPALQP